MVEVTD